MPDGKPGDIFICKLSTEYFCLMHVKLYLTGVFVFITGGLFSQSPNQSGGRESMLPVELCWLITVFS
jgi:hypothetical protein